MMTGRVTCRRIYDQAAAAAGARVLVDGVWPRGVRRQDAHLEEWMRDIAPSTDLRRWYGHDPERFTEFTRRYTQEMTQPRRQAAFERLRRLADEGDLTLLTATRDVEHSHAAVLTGWLHAGTVTPERPPTRR
jgi:uncharacterized protein YeaO (DUF488 family)